MEKKKKKKSAEEQNAIKLRYLFSSGHDSSCIIDSYHMKTINRNLGPNLLK